MRNSRKILIVVVAFTLALAGYYGYTQVFASKAPAPSTQTVQVTRGNLALSVSATGTLRPPGVADLSFRSSGVVEEVYVRVGDAVVKGQPLTKLEVRPLELQVTQAEIALRSTELSLQTLLEGSRPEDITSATAFLASAQQKLATMEAQGKPEDIAAVAANLLSAQARLEQLRNPTVADIGAAEAAVVAAAANLKNAQAKLDQLRNPTPADVAAAESALQSARARLEQLRNPTATDVAAAQAAVASTQVSLRNAQRKLDDLKTPPPEQVSEAEAVVKNAELALLNARASLDKIALDLSSDEKRRRLVEAYVQLFIARENLADRRARGASAEEIAAGEAAMIQALRAVELAEADVNYPQAGTTATQLRSAQNAVEAAQNNLNNARLKLDKLLHPSADDVATAEDSVFSARANLQSAQARLDQLRTPTAADLAAAESAVLTAQEKLAQLRNPKPADIATAEGAVVTAQANLQNAQAKLDQLRTPTAADLAAAESAALTAQQKLEQTRLPYTAVDLAAQRASVEQAAAQLSKLTNPGTALDIAKAQLSVDRARLDVEQARFNLDHALLLAPFDGIVSKVAVTPGVSQGIGASTVVMSIIDPSAMQVEVNVDETDIVKVDLTQTVQVTVEALGERPYRGKVIAIAPSATVQSGVTSYLVTISVDRPERLKAGMTAVVNIVYAQRQNVLLIPSRAIKTAGRDRTVQVLVNDKPAPRTIKVGLNDDQRTEVLEGLQEGDQVLMETGRGTAQGATQQVPRGAFAVPGVGGVAPGGGFQRPGGGR